MTQEYPLDKADVENVLGLSNQAKAKTRFRRGLVYGLLAAVLAAGAYYYFVQPTQTKTISYITQPITSSDLIVSVSATGTVQPITQMDVGSELSGIIKTVDVVDNDLVKKGDVLATLDVVRLSAQRDRAQAQVAAAEARLLDAMSSERQSTLTLSRQKKFRSSGLSTDQALEDSDTAEARANANVSVAKADLQSAKADLSIVETDVAKSQILSPIDGIVLKTNVKTGQTVAASLQAPVLFTLADNLAHIQIEAAVDEADIGQVKQGQKASFTVDAFRARNFTAEVGRISFAPDKTDGVVTYKTILQAPNDDLALRPGMTTTARIVVNEAKGVLAVPVEALRYVPAVQKKSGGFSITQLFMPRFPRSEKSDKPVVSADGSRSLWVLRSGKPVEVKIKTGLSDGKKTAVSGDDIHVDDAIILAVSGSQP
jgi:HlyD family secretion protein